MSDDKSPNEKVGGFLSRNWKWVALGVGVLALVFYLSNTFGG